MDCREKEYSRKTYSNIADRLAEKYNMTERLANKYNTQERLAEKCNIAGGFQKNKI